MLTNVYIDGFNLYRGCLKDARAVRWLDLRKLAGLLRPRDTIQEVKYFTAPIKGDATAAGRQAVYIRALRATGVTVDDSGFFQSHVVTRPVADVPSDGMKAVLESADKTTRTWKPEPRPAPGEWLRASVVAKTEKGSDVNLATHLMWDALRSRPLEAVVVISGDSDLASPISMIAKNVLPVHVVNPAKQPSQELRRAATSYQGLPLASLMLAQLPDPVMTGTRAIFKPPRWA